MGNIEEILNHEIVGIDKVLHQKPISTHLNLISVLGKGSDENAYSDILAAILRVPSVGMKFLTELFQRVRASDIPTLNTEYRVYREYYHYGKRLDIVIVFHKERFVVGLENKINANEGEAQISIYQSILEKEYSNYKSVFFFLSPKGKVSLTKNDKSKIHCYEISYLDVVSALETIKDCQEVSSCVDTLIGSINQEVIMDFASKEDCYRVWGNAQNKEKLLLLIENRPNLLGIKDNLVKDVSKYLETKADSICDLNQDKDPGDHEIRFTTNLLKSSKIYFVFYDKKDLFPYPVMWVIVPNWEPFSEKFLEKKKTELQNKCGKFGFPKIPRIQPASATPT